MGRSRLTAGGDLAEYGDVAAFGYLDDAALLAAVGGVVLGQPCAKSTRLRAHDRVLPGVVIRLAAEHLEGDQGFLDLLVPALEMRFHEKAQETGQTLVPRKPRAGKDALQFFADRLAVLFKGPQIARISSLLTRVQVYETLFQPLGTCYGRSIGPPLPE